ncbi:hypothetical protein BD779DRAFT_1704306 [Infundibulicybe gibba]|nr:hypothetical protein BD779DRAFT_1704306 [Infundibulicybe gibba]
MSKFIDTRQFQRLRAIKQLGTSYYVWIGASHNRFEHCIGVAHLARLMVEHLQQDQPELGITDREVACVEIAGLCHDLGHGPWSHVWDSLFIPAALKGSKWKHEDGSEMIHPPRDQSFIKALIAGDPQRCSHDEKPFLFEIVANRRNGLDVDKFDYILRDSQVIGDPMNISLQRIINSARVLENQICYDIKDANQLYEICATRFRLHKKVYNHKAAKAIEYMIIDGLLEAEPILNFAQQVFIPEKYIHLTDDIMPRIEASDDPRLAPAQAIFERIRVRELYKCVDYKFIDWPSRELFKEHVTPEKIVAAARKLPLNSTDPDHENVERLKSSLEAKDIIVDLSVMHYGMHDKNPLDFVKFYSKSNPDKCANAGRGDYSTLMPDIFAEGLLRVYTKDAAYFGIVQLGYRAILETMPGYLAGLSVDAGDGPPTRPSTPTETGSRIFSHSRNTSASSTLKSKTPSFSNNSFTTVAPNFPPISPSRAPRILKRRRESGGQQDQGGFPPRKRKS